MIDKKEWPMWLLPLYAHLGQREQAPGDNANVLTFYQLVRSFDTIHDETPWCAAGVGASFERVGIPTTYSLMARSFLNWGKPIQEPRVGAVAVFPRPPDPAAGHVNFVLDWNYSARTLTCLGGNQSDAVTIAEYGMDDVLGYRWPKEEPARSPIFDIALQQVLSVEGGYTNDPNDPGGPTNRGITLKEFAKWRGAEPTEALLSELKKISLKELEAIYMAGYWFKVWCDQLPPPLAIVHFDCAVNQGPGDAARFLQQAIGAEVDGEIGPKTLAQAQVADTRKALEAYYDIREADYRGLSQFGRYGKGWLRRNDEALQVALAVMNGRYSPVTNEKEKPMPTDPVPAPTVPVEPEPKWWGQSMTIWGTLITFASTVLPVLAKFYGVDITPDMIGELGDKALVALQAIGGLVGSVMAIYGRIRAAQPVATKAVTLKM